MLSLAVKDTSANTSLTLVHDSLWPVWPPVQCHFSSSKLHSHLFSALSPHLSSFSLFFLLSLLSLLSLPSSLLPFFSLSLSMGNSHLEIFMQKGFPLFWKMKKYEVAKRLYSEVHGFFVHECIHLCVYPRMYLCIHPPIHPSSQLSIQPPIRLFILHLSSYPFILPIHSLAIHPSIHSSTHTFIHVCCPFIIPTFTYLPIHPSIYPPTCPSIYTPPTHSYFHLFCCFKVLQTNSRPHEHHCS